MDYVTFIENANRAFITGVTKSVEANKTLLDVFVTNVTKANELALGNVKKALEGKLPEMPTVPGWEYFAPKAE